MSHVKKIIDRWDPAELFPWCPEDEYSSEIAEIRSMLSRIPETDRLLPGPEKTEALGADICELFRASFGEESFHKSLPECIRIAGELLAEETPDDLPPTGRRPI